MGIKAFTSWSSKANQQLEGISQTKAKMVINKTINPRLGMKLGRGISKIPSWN